MPKIINHTWLVAVDLELGKNKNRKFLVSLFIFKSSRYKQAALGENKNTNNPLE